MAFRNLAILSLVLILAIGTPSYAAPYLGSPSAIPGKIEAENYDTGGEGVAYHDTDAGNSGGQYRPTEGVDIESCSDTGGGYNVGWTNAGEWLEYTVNVSTAGTYNIETRVASASTGGTCYIEFNGVNKTGNITVPVTGGWQNWTTVNATAILSAGTQIMRFYEVTSGYNVNYFNITAASTVTVPNVVGQAQVTAQSNITASGLTVGVISQLYSDTVAAGNVISQNPVGGSSAVPGSSVSLVISLGIRGDLNGDRIVDFNDLRMMAVAWLTSDITADIEPAGGDGIVGFKDFAVLAENWEKRIQDPPYENLDLDVNDTQTFQKIDGFGASLTDSSAWLIYMFLNASERLAVLTDLFDPNEGIGLSYLRQPMGSSDLRLAEYSYDDRPSGQTDYNLSHFSIAYDANYIIPALLEIRAINPNVKIMGTPWSPPAWMKTSGSRITGHLIDDDRVYRALANYFVKFIQGYAAYGIDVNAVTLQNEPYYEPTSYPGMHMEPADQIRLVKFMGPAFEANSIDTKILIWDHNWDIPSFAITVLNDPVARPYIAGTAWHWYGGTVDAQTTVHNAYPDKDAYFTEGSDEVYNDGGFSANLIKNGTLIVGVIRNWGKTVIKWNLALDQNNGPKIAGGCDDCYGVVTINQLTRQVSHRTQYYALGQASKFLRPGAVRIGANDNIGGLRTVVFKNTDGSIVSYVVNPSSVSHNLKINWNGQWFIYTIPAQSIVTFRWNNTVSAIVQVMITSGDGSKLLEWQTPVMLHN